LKVRIIYLKHVLKSLQLL